ncbi:MAG: type VI secretion system baseplate subunit TssE [Desulfobacterales bacterium]|nr:type VI secretion system baseplate subunit TssE [Desulfobacterales bacterium]
MSEFNYLEKKKQINIRASLIDRLIDLEPKSNSEVRPLRALDIDALKASIARDIEWVLNTRTPLYDEEFDKRELTVIDYGIPDFGTYFTYNYDDRRRIIKRVEKAIYAFEPRLKNLDISVKSDSLDEKAMLLYINADIVIENIREPISFITITRNQTTKVKIHENK